MHPPHLIVSNDHFLEALGHQKSNHGRAGSKAPNKLQFVDSSHFDNSMPWAGE